MCLVTKECVYYGLFKLYMIFVVIYDILHLLKNLFRWKISPKTPHKWHNHVHSKKHTPNRAK